MIFTEAGVWLVYQFRSVWGRWERLIQPDAGAQITGNLSQPMIGARLARLDKGGGVVFIIKTFVSLRLNILLLLLKHFKGNELRVC